MKPAARLLLVVLVLLTLGGGLLAYRIWRSQQQAQLILAALPAVPDLSRWPAGFSKQVGQLTLEAARREDPTPALGRLATLYLANGYDGQAETILRELVRRESRSARWPYFLGVLRLRAGDKAAAESFFAQAADLAPDYAPAFLQWGDLLGMRGQLASARDKFEHRLTLLPEDTSAIYSLAKLDFAEGKINPAIKRLEVVLQHEPSFQEARLMLGDLLENKGDTAGAARQRSLLRPSQSAPPVADPWLDQAYLDSYDAYRMQAFGAMLMNAGKTAPALPFLQRALVLDPTDADVVDLLAKAFSDLGRLKNAEETLDAGLRLSPEAETLHSRLADVLLKHNKAAEALQRLLAANTSHPGKPAILTSLGKTYLALNREAEAEQVLQQALAINPALFDAQLNLGRCLLKLGKRPEARTALRRAHEMRTEDEGSLGLLAALELEDRDLEAAEKDATALLALDPAKTASRTLLAGVKLQQGNRLAESGENAGAEHAYKQGLELNPNSAPLHGALGMLFGKKRNFPEAITEFKAYIELERENPFGYLLLGSAYAATGRRLEARSSWEKGLSAARQNGETDRAQQIERMLKSLPE